MLIAGVFSSSSKFSVNSLLAVQLLLFFIILLRSQSKQKATAGEVHKAPGLSASYCSHGWPGSWRHSWKHWGMSHRTVHGTQTLVSKQGARNLVTVWDDLVMCPFFIHSPPLLAFTIYCINKSFSIQLSLPELLKITQFYVLVSISFGQAVYIFDLHFSGQKTSFMFW